MKVFLISAAVLLVCIAFMCFNLIFRKNGEFPDGEISHNKEMKKLGIRCVKEEEMRLWGKKDKTKPSCSDSSCSECASCGFYHKEEE